VTKTPGFASCDCFKLLEAIACLLFTCFVVSLVTDFTGLSLPGTVLEEPTLYAERTSLDNDRNWHDRRHEWHDNERAAEKWRKEHRWLPASKRIHDHIFTTSSEGFKLAASQASVSLTTLFNAMPAWTDDFILLDIIKCLKQTGTADQTLPLFKLVARDPWAIERCFSVVHSTPYSDFSARTRALNRSESDVGPPKIIQIGFNKAGTRSIWKFLHDISVASAHWEGGYLAQSIDKNLLNGERLLDGYEELDGFTDLFYFATCIPEREKVTKYPGVSANKYFRSLDRQYPGSLFILNTRGLMGWIESRAKHPGNCNVHWVNHWPDMRYIWALEWHVHMAGVLSYFAGYEERKPTGDLLVLDIAQDDSSLLHAFLLTPAYLRDVEIEKVINVEKTLLCHGLECPSIQERANEMQKHFEDLRKTDEARQKG